MVKIPDHAKKVFSGVIFDIYQWDQELFDGSIETFEAARRPDSVQVIPITEEGKILINKEEQPNYGSFYGFIGGVIDEGEEPLTAAKRELREETGYGSDDWQLFEAIPFPGKVIWSVHVYFARQLRKMGEPTLDAGEKIETLAVNIDEFVDMLTNKNFRAKMVANKLMPPEFTENSKEEFKKIVLGR